MLISYWTQSVAVYNYTWILNIIIIIIIIMIIIIIIIMNM